MPENKMTVTEFARKGGYGRAKKLTREEMSESNRRAANARWARVRAKVEESRRAQGLDPTVSDDKALGDLAAQVISGGGPS